MMIMLLEDTTNKEFNLESKCFKWIIFQVPSRGKAPAGSIPYRLHKNQHL